jgi:hypothetical protein
MSQLTNLEEVFFFFFGNVNFKCKNLLQLLYFWTLFIVLPKKTPFSFISKHNVSETGFCLRLQVKPTQLGPIDRISPYLRTPVPTQDGVYEPRSFVVLLYYSLTHSPLLFYTLVLSMCIYRYLFSCNYVCVLKIIKITNFLNSYIILFNTFSQYLADFLLYHWNHLL